MAILNVLKTIGRNAESDECYTPPGAITPLLKYLDKSKTYYEATSGKSSQMLDTMREHGFTVEASNGSDFFEVDNVFDGVITNPPYSIKDKFIEACYASGKPFALLLPVASMQGQKRGAMFAEHGIEILVLNKRIDFTGKGAPHFGVAWFCHGILPEKLIFDDCK